MAIFKPLSFGVVFYTARKNGSIGQVGRFLRRCPHKAKGLGANRARLQYGGVPRQSTGRGSQQPAPKHSKGVELSGHEGVVGQLV